VSRVSEEDAMPATVRDLLRRKGGVVNSVRADTNVFEVVQQFIAHNIGAVLVMDGAELVGIVSERDVARNVVLEVKTERETAVTEIMTHDVFTVGPDTRVEECMALMTDKRIRHLPVVADGRLIGIVSIGDLVNALLSEKQFIIEQLEGYITGRA
jgi:CBS domain-containing protein